MIYKSGYNMPVSMFKTYSDGGEVWENSSKRSYVYDPVVHNFYTERKGYDWVDGEFEFIVRLAFSPPHRGCSGLDTCLCRMLFGSIGFEPVVHNFYTERKGYDWVDGEWVKDYYWESNEIVRDDKGNITSLTKYVPLFGGEQCCPWHHT